MHRLYQLNLRQAAQIRFARKTGAELLKYDRIPAEPNLV